MLDLFRTTAGRVAMFGSREVDRDTSLWLSDLAYWVSRRGFTVLTAFDPPGPYVSGVFSSNKAIFDGAVDGGSPVEVFYKAGTAHPVPEDGVVIHSSLDALPEDHKRAEEAHPKWAGLGPYIQEILIRNAMAMRTASLLIVNLNPKKPWGGSAGHFVKLAGLLNVPVMDVSPTKPLRREFQVFLDRRSNLLDSVRHAA